MLSGNGRHRRPRQAPALLVAAGVTGSAIAIPLLGAASANAADGTTWDKVAECESGGSWSADTGNGYYGGLQISQEDWNAYGGGQYAASPDQASRNQQIAVAEKILADKGTTPWATCALLSGLTEDSGATHVDTGVGGSGGSGGSSGSGKTSGSAGNSGTSGGSGSSGNSDSSGLPDSSPSADTDSDTNSGSGNGSSSDKATTPSAKPDKDAGAPTGSKGTDTPKSDKSTAPDTGSPRGADSSPTAAPDTGIEDNPQQAAGSWSLVDTGSLGGGRHRGASADESGTDESVTNGQSASSSGRHASREADTYTVRQGDTLASIADSLDVDGGWRALYAGNKKSIGADPNHISAGQTLDVEGEAGGE
ncbi:peptidoglycan-binding protein LysM [Streptomyces olivaceoviridis]|uniref:LysM peptidoglycan-binding domain-containing protein n=1 Tax=Streptomyces olivaceoviridis TaxID=1921 RepID=UPI001675FAF4|nr:transglycosylase family protein [Streptomyces olivaceoviridis]GGY71928.1 peptidoglycan-binding protein LysM [Streptomyces olivaceoviridis]